MRTFDNLIEALQFSEKNPNTLVKWAIYCYLYNGKYHGVFDQAGTSYRSFNINGSVIDVSSLSEIQLQSIFCVCY